MTIKKSIRSQIITFGCRLNRYESEVIGQHTEGLKEVVVVNTCAVTSEAERQAKQAIRRLYRENNNKRIVVTGCAAQLNPQEWSTLPGVVQVLGNEDKLLADNWTNLAIDSGDRVSDIMSVKKSVTHAVTEFTGRTRAFVQVQQGCDHRCTFCVIPFGRGPSRSVPFADIVSQIEILLQKKYQEVVLTGVDIASWGKDFFEKKTLGNLCKLILNALPELRRLRLSSMDPIGFDDDLWELLAHEPRFMPHLHLSVQSGSDMILKRMKRRHLTKDVDQLVQKLRFFRPDIGLSADVITGFPTENDKLFQETLEFLKAQAFPYLHVFPYSERKGTPASRMPPVPKILRKERAAVLRELGNKTSEDYHQSLVGRKVHILLESPDCGHSEYHALARLRNCMATSGEVISAKVVSADSNGIWVER